MRLTDTKGRRHNFELVAGKRFFSNKGHIDHDELIGREEGFTVTASTGLATNGIPPRIPPPAATSCFFTAAVRKMMGRS